MNIIIIIFLKSKKKHVSPPPPPWATFSGLAQIFMARAAVARHFAPPPPLSKHPGAAPAYMYA